MKPRYATVAARARHRCEYCHAPEALFNFPFEVEHIIPPLRGGTNDDTNLALACRACNLFKSDRIDSIDPESKSAVSLFHPRTNTWHEHFHVAPRTGEIVGLTPAGRATVGQLKMNSPPQLAARIQWMRLGLFP